MKLQKNPHKTTTKNTTTIKNTKNNNKKQPQHTNNYAVTKV